MSSYRVRLLEEEKAMQCEGDREWRGVTEEKVAAFYMVEVRCAIWKVEEARRKKLGEEVRVWCWAAWAFWAKLGMFGSFSLPGLLTKLTKFSLSILETKLVTKFLSLKPCPFYLVFSGYPRAYAWSPRCSCHSIILLKNKISKSNQKLHAFLLLLAYLTQGEMDLDMWGQGQPSSLKPPVLRRHLC